jgi:Uma2 family endonuclease
MSAAKRIVPGATRADLDDLPPTWRGEIIDGTLYAFPRPRPAHAQVKGRVHGDVDGPFGRGRGGPGGWWILTEPGIELPRAKEFSPDVAGWRRERLPRLPVDEPIAVAPDWICEVLSKSTRSYDQIVKRRFYASIGVGHLWYVEPIVRTLTVSRRVGEHWLELGVHGADDKVRAEPFEEVEIELAAWFEGIPTDGDG